MPNIWFTADFRLGHKNIMRYCNRPFDTVEEMNRTIIERLNSLVKANDILYFLPGRSSAPRTPDMRFDQSVPKIQCFQRVDMADTAEHSVRDRLRVQGCCIGSAEFVDAVEGFGEFAPPIYGDHFRQSIQVSRFVPL